MKEDGPEKLSRRRFLKAGIAVVGVGAAAALFPKGENKTVEDEIGQVQEIPHEPLPRIEEISPQRILGMRSILEEQLKHTDAVRFGSAEQNLLNVAWLNRMQSRDYIHDLIGANRRIRSGIDGSSTTTYLERITKEFENEIVPPRLCYIAFSETWFTLKDKKGDPVRSPAGAVGPYQFTEATGVKYGLVEKDEETKKIIRDDRGDPILSAGAAARLLSDLAESFMKKQVPRNEAWEFAVLSYNGSFAQTYRNNSPKPTMAEFREFMTAKMREKLEKAESDWKIKVRPGETQESLSVRYGISARALGEANPKVDWSKLIAHQTEVTISGLKNAPLYEEVEQGETLALLAKRFNVTEKAIKDANPKITWKTPPSHLEISVPKDSRAFADFVRKRKLIVLSGIIENLDYLAKTRAIIHVVNHYDLSPRVPLPPPRPRI